LVTNPVTPPSSPRHPVSRIAHWHLDEVYLKIDGRMVYLWRAVDAEGEVLDVLVQTRRSKRAALKLMRKLLKKYGFVPEKLITDDLLISS
jgi:putative transposase